MNIEEISLLEGDEWLDENVSIKTKEKLKRLKSIDDKKRSLGGELLARYAIAYEKSIPKDSIVFSAYENGKPYCINYLEVHFNISHSGSWVICVVSDEPIGVDIEKIGVSDTKIAKRFFSECEYKELLSVKMDRNEMFYKLWTLKESYIKYTGNGLKTPLDSLVFDMSNGNAKLKFPETNLLCFNSMKVFENYYLSVCSKEQCETIEVKEITFNEIKNCV